MCLGTNFHFASKRLKEATELKKHADRRFVSKPEWLKHAARGKVSDDRKSSASRAIVQKCRADGIVVLAAFALFVKATMRERHVSLFLAFYALGSAKRRRRM